MTADSDQSNTNHALPSARGLVATGVLSAAVCLAVTATPASAEIVKAPTGASSELTLNAAALKRLKRYRVSLAAIGAAKKSKSTLSLPYSLARWDFAAREGDVVHFQRNTGLRLRRRGGRAISMVHPRVILEGGNGYITALIAGVRVKTFTFKLSSGKVTESAGQQHITGLRVKLTKASADYLNRGLKRKVLRRYSQAGTLNLNLVRPAATATVALSSAPGQGTNPGATVQLGPGVLGTGRILSPIAPAVEVDVDGDGQPDAGVIALPLEGASFDATTRTGTISLDGGLVLSAGGQDVVRLDDPEIIIGTTADSSGLYALVNGARIKVGNIDPSTLNVSVADDTINVRGLNVTASTAALGLPGLGLLPPETQLMTVDLSLPRQ